MKKNNKANNPPAPNLRGVLENGIFLFFYSKFLKTSGVPELKYAFPLTCILYQLNEDFLQMLKGESDCLNQLLF